MADLQIEEGHHIPSAEIIKERMSVVEGAYKQIPKGEIPSDGEALEPGDLDEDAVGQIIQKNRDQQMPKLLENIPPNVCFRLCMIEIAGSKGEHSHQHSVSRKPVLQKGERFTVGMLFHYQHHADRIEQLEAVIHFFLIGHNRQFLSHAAAGFFCFKSPSSFRVSGVSIQ